jgi:hypothetical protein
MFDMRKIQIGQVGQLLAVDVAPLNHYSPRPRRTFSEIELIFKESTNVAAALVRAWGMRRSAKLVPLSRVGIFLSLFDFIAPYGRIARWRERVISSGF